MSSKAQTPDNDTSLSGHQAARPETQSAAIQDQPVVPASAAQKAKITPQLLVSRDVLQLQRTLGNRAVTRLLARSTSSVEEVPRILEATTPSTTTSASVLQRAIKIDGKKISTDDAFKLIRKDVIQFAVPPGALQQVLTRMDFSNQSFSDAKKLAAEVTRLLREEYSLPMPSLSSEEEISISGPSDFVILGRGCHSLEQLNAILKNSSAGGDAPDVSAVAPTESEAVSDVAFEGVPWKVTGQQQLARRQTDRVEFTTLGSVLRGFAGRGGAVLVQIQKKYLTKGSGSEQGWIAKKSAPVVVLWVSQ